MPIFSRVAAAQNLGSQFVEHVFAKSRHHDGSTEFAQTVAAETKAILTVGGWMLPSFAMARSRDRVHSL